MFATSVQYFIVHRESYFFHPAPQRMLMFTRVVDHLRGIGALTASPTAVIVNVSPDLDLGAANFVRIRRA